MWSFGDVGKTLYFVLRQAPAQFWLCGTMQVMIDLAIMLQVFYYGTSHVVHRRASDSNLAWRIAACWLLRSLLLCLWFPVILVGFICFELLHYLELEFWCSWLGIEDALKQLCQKHCRNNFTFNLHYWQICLSTWSVTSWYNVMVNNSSFWWDAAYLHLGTHNNAASIVVDI